MKPEELTEGWIEDYEIRNKKDCHPSTRIQIIKIKDVLEIIDELHYDWQNIRINNKKLTKDEIIDKASFLILIKKDLIKQISEVIE